MKKKKICFIAQFPPPMHGLSKAVETLYNSNLNKNVNPAGEFEFEKIDITNNRKILKNLITIYKSNADLFYFTISQTKYGNLRDLVIFKLLEVQHKKCLIHLHGGYYRKLVDCVLPYWQKKANYKALSKINGAIVLGKSLKKNFEGMLSMEKIYTVPNCVDDEYLMNDKEFRLKIDTIKQRKVKHVLYLSNFIKTKGYREVLELARLEKKRVDAGGEKMFHFDFAGAFFNKDERDFFYNFLKKNDLNSYLTYHGAVGGDEKRVLLNNCDVFVLLTKYEKEGQPISILEAMGNGMVIVATKHAGIPDIVKDGINGFLMEKDETNLVENVYAKILKITDFPKIEKAGRDIVLQNYLESTYISNLKKIFFSCGV